MRQKAVFVQVLPSTNQSETSLIASCYYCTPRALNVGGQCPCDYTIIQGSELYTINNFIIKWYNHRVTVRLLIVLMLWSLQIDVTRGV